MSPDGEKIAYTFHDGLYVVNTDGTGNLKLLEETWVFTRWWPPVWSPDGKWIVYAASAQALPSSMTDRDIYVLKADGSDKFELPEAVGIPVWSSDGKKILYTTGSTDKHGGVYVINADGTGKLELVKEGSPGVWFPDGKQILYGLVSGVTYVINVDGTGNRKLLEKGGGFVWSPDGKKIAYRYGEDLYVMNSDGTSQVKLTNKEVFGKMEFVWSPDSQYIAFTSTNGRRLYVADVNTGKLTMLASESSWQSTGISGLRWLLSSK